MRWCPTILKSVRGSAHASTSRGTPKRRSPGDAIEELQDKQDNEHRKKTAGPSIPVGYFTLLARIQVNLGEFEQAVKTLDSYPFKETGAKRREDERAIDTERKTLKAKLAVLGSDCLHAGDLDCADEVSPRRMPSIRIPRRCGSGSPGSPWSEPKSTRATEEEKAKKPSSMDGVHAGRIWLEEAGPPAAVSATRAGQGPPGHEDDGRLRGRISHPHGPGDGAEDAAKRDTSIQRDLAWPMRAWNSGSSRWPRPRRTSS